MTQLLNTYLVIRPEAEHLDKVIDFYRTARVIEASIPFGLLRGELLLSRNTPQDVTVASLWKSQHHYDSWLVSRERRSLLATMVGTLGSCDISGWTTPAAESDDSLAPHRPIDVTAVYWNQHVYRPIVVTTD